MASININMLTLRRRSKAILKRIHQSTCRRGRPQDDERADSMSSGSFGITSSETHRSPPLLCARAFQKGGGVVLAGLGERYEMMDGLVDTLCLKSPISCRSNQKASRAPLGWLDKQNNFAGSENTSVCTDLWPRAGFWKHRIHIHSGNNTTDKKNTHARPKEHCGFTRFHHKH